MNREEKFMTVRELADRWRTSPGAIHQRRWRGDCPPAFDKGARLLFDIADVEAFEADHRSENTSEVRR